ncbi:hypothetical protein JW877_08040 [bacterium]|nr:hypothetical protein [bacterium]
MDSIKCLLYVLILISLLLYFCSNAENPDNNDNNYPTSEDPFPALDADSLKVTGEGTLVLTDGTSLDIYGNTGMTVFMSIDISERDPVPDKLCYHLLTTADPDSIRLSGPVPAEATSDSLVAIWQNPDEVVHTAVPGISGGEYSLLIIGSPEYIELAWPWQTGTRSAKLAYHNVVHEGIPYYEQYNTDHCWATVTAMFDHYYYNIPEAWISTKFWEVAGRIGWADGASAYKMRFGWDYSNFVNAQVGKKPSIYAPWYPSSLRKYLQAQVIDSNRVVGLYLSSYEGSEAHMVLVVGWINPGEDNEQIVIHDPSDVETGMYKEKWWHDIIADAHTYGDISIAGCFKNYYLAVTIPKSESEAYKTPTLSVGYTELEPYGIYLDPDTSARPLGLRPTAAKLKLEVIPGNQKGYNWVGISGGNMPIISNKHKIHPWVRIYNPRETPQNLELHSAIYQNSNRLVSSDYKTLTVPAKSWQQAINDTLILEGNITQPGEYELIVNLYGETMLDHYDRIDIVFSVDTIIADSHLHISVSPDEITASYGQDIGFVVSVDNVPNECILGMEIWLNDTVGFENYLGFITMFPESINTISIDGCDLDEFDHGICPGTNNEIFLIITDFWGYTEDIYEIVTIPLNINSGIANAWDFYENAEMEIAIGYYSEFFRPISAGSNTFTYSYDTTYRDSSFDDTITADLRELPPGNYLLEYTRRRNAVITVSDCYLTGQIYNYTHVVGLDMIDPIEPEDEHDERFWYIMDTLFQSTVSFSGPVRIGVGCTWEDSCGVSMWFEEGECDYTEINQDKIEIALCRNVYWWYNSETESWIRADSSFANEVLYESADTTRHNVSPWIGVGDFRIDNGKSQAGKKSFINAQQ